MVVLNSGDNSPNALEGIIGSKIYQLPPLTKDTRAGIFSMKKSSSQYVKHLIEKDSGISHETLVHGLFKPDEFSKFLISAVRLHDAPVFIVEAHDQSIDEICSQARRLKEKESIEILVIDSLDMESTVTSSSPDHLRTGVDIREIASLSFELGIPIIALIQNRENSMENKPNETRIGHSIFLPY